MAFGHGFGVARIGIGTHLIELMYGEMRLSHNFATNPPNARTVPRKNPLTVYLTVRHRHPDGGVGGRCERAARSAAEGSDR